MTCRIVFLGLLINLTACFSDTFTFTSTYPVIGPPQEYAIFQVSLSLPTSSDPDFYLSVTTNYGATIPGFPDVVPLELFNGTYYPMSDFLISWKGGYYGVIMSRHDGYTPGDLYQASGFQTSGEVLVFYSPRPTVPVLIDPGGTMIGSGVLSGAVTGDLTTGMYTITDRFTAPAGFLTNGEFDIIMSSFVCANGLITGSATDPPTVPEPSSSCEVVLGLVLGCGILRRRLRTARSTVRPLVVSSSAAAVRPDEGCAPRGSV